MELKNAVPALSALAQDTRLAVLRLLVRAGPAGMAAGAIADSLELPGNTLSFHLSQLDRAGLVSARRAGRSIIYAADYGAMDRLVDFLRENCCAGAPGAVSVPVAAQSIHAARWDGSPGGE